MAPSMAALRFCQLGWHGLTLFNHFEIISLRQCLDASGFPLLSICICATVPSASGGFKCGAMNCQWAATGIRSLRRTPKSLLVRMICGSAETQSYSEVIDDPLPFHLYRLLILGYEAKFDLANLLMVFTLCLAVGAANSPLQLVPSGRGSALLRLATVNVLGFFKLKYFL